MSLLSFYRHAFLTNALEDAMNFILNRLSQNKTILRLDIVWSFQKIELYTNPPGTDVCSKLRFVMKIIIFKTNTDFGSLI